MTPTTPPAGSLESASPLPTDRPLMVRDTVEFDSCYGADYLRMGWRYGRIEGHHHYDQAVYDLRKLELVGERYRPTGVLIYMVPAWAVQRAAIQEFVAPQETPDGQAQA